MKNRDICLGIKFLAVALITTLTQGESFGRTRSVLANPDTTLAGQGTGLFGAGKGPTPLNLGMAGNYVILAKTGISTTGTTAITGNIGVSPVAASYITGFSLMAPPTSYSTSTLVTGKAYAADYDSPTPTNLTTAVLDMEAAYTDAAGRAADYTELSAGDIGGMTLAPAVYKWSTDLLIPADVTLSGGPFDVWIFQIAGNLTQTSGVKIVLMGGALPKNIFWQVAGSVVLQTTSHFEGILLSQTAISLKTGATVNGRELAQTAVVLDANTLVEPSMAPIQGLASLAIEVRKAKDSVMISNATLILKRSNLQIDSVRVDTAGKYTFTNLPASNNYSLTVSAPTYFSTTTTLTVGSNQVKTMNVYLVVQVPGTLTGILKNSSANIPIANALVVLRRISSKGPILDSVRSDSTGTYLFRNIATGSPNYWITAKTAFGESTRDSILVASGATVTVNFNFSSTVTLANHSRDSEIIRFIPMGARLSVELGISKSIRTLSIFEMNGSLHNRITVPPGQARIIIQESLSPANGFLFQVK